MAKIVKFACLIGLRPSEVCESVRLICKSTDKSPGSQTTRYYNPERQALEHFRFPEIFLRQTKKAYISFVTAEMIEPLLRSFGLRVPTYSAITHTHLS
jgi:hypothetical protein